jgi:hypothetical protein
MRRSNDGTLIFRPNRLSWKSWRDAIPLLPELPELIESPRDFRPRRESRPGSRNIEAVARVQGIGAGDCGRDSEPSEAPLALYLEKWLKRGEFRRIGTMAAAYAAFGTLSTFY